MLAGMLPARRLIGTAAMNKMLTNTCCLRLLAVRTTLSVAIPCRSGLDGRLRHVLGHLPGCCVNDCLLALSLGDVDRWMHHARVPAGTQLHSTTTSLAIPMWSGIPFRPPWSDGVAWEACRSDPRDPDMSYPTHSWRRLLCCAWAYAAAARPSGAQVPEIGSKGLLCYTNDFLARSGLIMPFCLRGSRCGSCIGLFSQPFLVDGGSQGPALSNYLFLHIPRPSVLQHLMLDLSNVVA